MYFAHATAASCSRGSFGSDLQATTPNRVPSALRHRSASTSLLVFLVAARILRPAPLGRDPSPSHRPIAPGGALVARPCPTTDDRSHAPPRRPTTGPPHGIHAGAHPAHRHRSPRRPRCTPASCSTRRTAVMPAVLDGDRRRDNPHLPGTVGDVDHPVRAASPRTSPTSRPKRPLRPVEVADTGAPRGVADPHQGHRAPVDVFITIYGESLETIRKTVTAALAMRGSHNTWVLDDGKSDEVRDLAAELGAATCGAYSSGGAKAGNVNHALTLAKGEFFAIFDADFVPDPTFLVETVPFFVDREGRLRADAADLRQPAHHICAAAPATCRPSSTASSSPAAIASTPRSAWAPTCCSDARPSRTWAASTPSRSPRTSGRRSCCTSAAGDRSTSPMCSPSERPPSRSRRTPSSNCGGPRADSRSCSRTTR